MFPAWNYLPKEERMRKQAKIEQNIYILASIYFPFCFLLCVSKTTFMLFMVSKCGFAGDLISHNFPQLMWKSGYLFKVKATIFHLRQISSNMTKCWRVEVDWTEHANTAINGYFLIYFYCWQKFRILRNIIIWNFWKLH